MRSRAGLASARCRAGTLVVLAVALGMALLGGQARAQPAGQVLRTEVTGVISPVVSEHLADAVEEAEEGGYAALLIELDTPGGLLTSMEGVVQTLLGARVPTIVYVAPSGAKAASAGAIITFAAHVAAMAPGTNIGAATPVSLGEGEVPDEVYDKLVNDAAAYVEAIAQARGRNAEFAVETVTEGRSVSYREALELEAIDVVADSRGALLAEIDGREVVVGPQSVDDPEATGEVVVLDTAGATVTDYDMSFTREALQALANPDLAFLLLSVGSLAVIYELANPGAIIPGVLGAVMLVLAFFSLAQLPTNLAGVVLLVIAIGLFVAELFAPGIGVFAGGGAIALIAAGLFLFQSPTGVGVDLSFLVPIAAAVAVVAVVIGRYALRTQRSSPYRGQGGTMLGAVGTVRDARGGHGHVHVHGQLWRARAEQGDLRRGEDVEVVAVEGLEVVVRPVSDRQHQRG